MKRPVALLAVILFLIPAALVTYRAAVLGYPLFPSVPGETWEITMDARLTRAQSEMGALWVGLPSGRPGMTVLEEQFHSGVLDFGLTREGLNRFGIFSGPLTEEEQRLHYRAIIVVQPPGPLRAAPLRLRPYPAEVRREDADLLERLAGKWQSLPVPARLETVAGASLGAWGEPPPPLPDRHAWLALQERLGRAVALAALLRAAHINTRVIEGLPLVESVRRRPQSIVEAWDGRRWTRLRPETGEQIHGTWALLPLTFGGASALRATEGRLSDVRWVVSRRTPSHWRMHFQRLIQSGRFLDRWSFFHLPQEFQETFRILLLVPLGALLIGILRNIVGFPTFGTFMPVLMALGFRSMGLLYGLAIFTGVIGIGYLLRWGLNRLRLLLVPRLSVMLTMVISCLGFFALLGSQLGLREFMAVGLLPFVILTMVIERFFVLIEESGLREGVRTALGSAAAAVICYGILHWDRLQLTFFLYPELLLAVAAFQVLLGRYTGYRLSELLRFRVLRSQA